MDEVQKPPNALDRLDAILGKGLDVAGRVWDANAQVVAHGSAEVAAALYSPSGSAYVMYGEGATPAKGQEQQATAARGQSPYGPEQEQDHGMER